MKLESFFDYPSDDGRADSDFVLLEHWSDDQWRVLRSFTEYRRFRAGESVVSMGETDRSLHVVIEGTLEVLLGGRRPRRTTLGAGSLIGEVAFFDGLPRTADVRAVTDADLLHLTPERFEVFAAKHPDLGRELLMDLGRLLALRLRQSYQLLGA